MCCCPYGTEQLKTGEVAQHIVPFADRSPEVTRMIPNCMGNPGCLQGLQNRRNYRSDSWFRRGTKCRKSHNSDRIGYDRHLGHLMSWL